VTKSGSGTWTRSPTADRATNLTSQLLAFARRQTLLPQVFDGGTNVAALHEMLPTLTGALVEISFDPPDETTPFLADPSQLDMAIVNMAVNARDTMTGEGQLATASRIVPASPPLRSHPAVYRPHVAPEEADDPTTAVALDLVAGDGQ
jgi:C4-dicarboxylate-specific signal transduction histidine kinase